MKDEGAAVGFPFILHPSSFILPSATLSDKRRPEGEQGGVADEKPKVTNEIPEGTGQFDNRFVLWRTFCAEAGIPVETLPSDLTGDARDKWEQLKNERLHKPAENRE